MMMITVIMKITKKIMKILLSKVIIPKLTFVQILTMPSKKFKITSYHPTYHRTYHPTQQGYQKHGPSQNFFNIRAKQRPSFHGTSPKIFCFKRMIDRFC